MNSTKILSILIIIGVVAAASALSGLPQTFLASLPAASGTSGEDVLLESGQTEYASITDSPAGEGSTVSGGEQQSEFDETEEPGMPRRGGGGGGGGGGGSFIPQDSSSNGQSSFTADDTNASQDEEPSGEPPGGEDEPDEPPADSCADDSCQSDALSFDGNANIARVEYNELTESEATERLVEKISEIREGISRKEWTKPLGSKYIDSINENLDQAELFLSQGNLMDAINSIRTAWEFYRSLDGQAGRGIPSPEEPASVEIVGAYLNGRIWANGNPTRFTVVVKNNLDQPQQIRVNAQPKGWYIIINSFFGMITSITKEWEPLGADQNQALTLNPSETKKLDFEFTVTGYDGGYNAANVIFKVESLSTGDNDEYHFANSMYSSLPPWGPEGNTLGDTNISMEGVWAFAPARILSPDLFTIAMRNNIPSQRTLRVYVQPQKFEGVQYGYLSSHWDWYYTDTGEAYWVDVSIEADGSKEFSAHPTFTTIDDTYSGGWFDERAAIPLTPMGRVKIGFTETDSYWNHHLSLAEGFHYQPSLEITSPPEGASFYEGEPMNVIFSFKDESWSETELPATLQIEYRLKDSDPWIPIMVNREAMSYSFQTAAPSEFGAYTLTVKTSYLDQPYTDSINYTVRSADLYIEWIKPIQVVEDVPLVAGKATVVRVKVINTGPPLEAIDVSINYNGWTETQTVSIEDETIVDFYPPNEYTT